MESSDNSTLKTFICYADIMYGMSELQAVLCYVDSLYQPVNIFSEDIHREQAG